MNILLINHYAGSRVHGMEYRPYYLAREWTRCGHEATIVAASCSHVRMQAPRLQGSVTVEHLDGIRYIWLKTPAYAGNGVRRGINMFSFVSRLLRQGSRLAQDLRPDAVIASSTYPLDVVPAIRIASASRARLIFEVHDLWPLTPIELGGMSPRHPFICLLQWAENLAYRKADAVVSILPNAKPYMLEHGMAADKFVHIPNGIDVAEWESDMGSLPPEHETSLANLERSGRFLVGYFGAHGLANALESLIGAAELLKSERIAMVLVGEGPEKQGLQDLAQRLQLPNVVFLPTVPKPSMPVLLGRMHALYIGLKGAPIFRFGISPNKLIDYLMAARPIIQAIEAGNDMVTEAGCGFSIPPEDATATADAIRKLMAVPETQRRDMGLKGRAYVLANHDYRVLSRRFLEVLAEGPSREGSACPAADVVC